MRAMILAAGRGERLRPITDTIPKPLLVVDEKPLIVHHLEALSIAGFESVVINLGWLGEQIRERLGNGSDYGIAIEYSVEDEALETAGGIVQALDRLGERFVVVNADVYTDYDFARLKNIDVDAHLVLVENPQHNPDGDFTLIGSQVGNLGDRCYTFAGISQFHRRFFENLAPGRRSMAPLLRKSAKLQQLSGELFRGNWTDVGTVERWQAPDQGNSV